MKQKSVNFVIAVSAVMAVFFAIHSMPHKEGKALASAPATAAKVLGDDYSASQKRTIRRAMSADAGNVMNFSGQDIQAVLDAPGLIRRDLPTVIWQYRNDACVLDLYFTTSDPSALEAPVAHYEVRARAAKGVADEMVQESCVRDLVRARSGVTLVNVSAFYKAN